MHQATSTFGAANPYALSSILQAGDACPIVASEDICDDRGVKLWARHQPVTPALQERLLDRKLRQPLEACLQAPDGVTAANLAAATRRLFDTPGPLAHALRPWAQELVAEVGRLPLHSVVQLLLTATRGSRPQAFAHAIHTMVLAGAMYMHAGSDRYELRLALLAGLVHDVGELYVNPELLEPDVALTPAGFRHVVVHPRIGEMLLSKLTDYPPDLYRAVGEHHERGNGMGYPLRARYLSWLGCRLSAVETLAGVLASDEAQAWEHGSLALRLIPGEFDPVAIAFTSQAARRARSQAQSVALPDAQAVWHHSQQLAERIDACAHAAQQLAEASAPGRVQENAALAAELLTQLTQAGKELGVWAPRKLMGEQLSELHVANQEMQFRLDAIQRISTWLDVGLQAAEEAALAQLWLPPAHPAAPLAASSTTQSPCAAPHAADAAALAEPAQVAA